jgi:hypothetical protein
MCPPWPGLASLHGMAVRNLCRERLSDDELAACCGFGGDWDNCYIGVLAAIAAMRQ